MTDNDGRLEARLRRMAARQGLQMQKCRARDPRAIGYGTYQLVDPSNNCVNCLGLQSGYGLTIDDVAESLGARPMIDRSGNGPRALQDQGATAP